MSITTKFDNFKSKKIKNFEKDKEFQPLSDDIIAISKLDNGDYEKVKGPIKIVQVTGVITDEDEIKKLDEIAGGPVFTTDLGVKQVKRGDVIWITAFIQKPGTQSWTNQQSQATLKCRIVDIYMVVHAYQKGELKDASPAVRKAAKGMTKKAAKDFAETKHKGLPEKVKKESRILNFENFVNEKYSG